MIDLDLLHRLHHSDEPTPPAPLMPAWKYALIVCGLQFGPWVAIILALGLWNKLFD